MAGALTENVAVLSLCRTTFDPVTEIDLPTGYGNDGKNYALSIQQEQKVAEAFAILLANTDDPHSVGAVCLEEQPDKNGLLIRTAVNSGLQKERTANFTKIAEALRECTAGKDLDAFFGAIVTICKARLLIRLRSSHAKTHRKAATPAILSKLLEGVRLLKDMPIEPHQLASVNTQVALLEVSFRSLECLSSTAVNSEPGTRMLKSILLAIERLLACSDIVRLLQMIPKNIPSWSGPASESLVKSLTIFAQYSHAAQYLLKRARRNLVFRALSIAEVPLRLSSEGSVSAEPRSTSASSSALSIARKQKMHTDALFTKLGATLRKTRAEIELSVRKHAEQSKRVHAEVQLLLYYEENPTPLRPRIIASNKHACLLCNLLINAHGGFLIRSCHGRLYPRWRIPPLDELRLTETAKLRMQRAINEMNHHLELKIRHHLDHAQSRIPDPQESIVFVQDVCTPSTISTASHPAAATTIASTRSCSDTSGVSATLNSVSLNQPQDLYVLEHSHSIETRVHIGFPVRVFTPRIHLELTYEWALLSASSISVGTTQSQEPKTSEDGLLVQIEYILERSLESSAVLQYVCDLAAPSGAETIFPGTLLSEHGLVLKKRDDVVILRVIK